MSWALSRGHLFLPQHVSIMCLVFVAVVVPVSGLDKSKGSTSITAWQKSKAPNVIFASQSDKAINFAQLAPTIAPAQSSFYVNCSIYIDKFPQMDLMYMCFEMAL